MPRAFVTGVAGHVLSADERAFIADADPWGLILFARNIASAEDIRRLCGDFRAVVGRDAAVLIDQEGGRVQRIRPPVVRAYPSARAYGHLHQTHPEKALEACRLGGRLMADDLRRLGITINCAPCLDLPAPGADAVIGDRAFASDAQTVAALALAFAAGLSDGGVEPVIKHVPGHGRATVDSHKALPVVAATRDDLSAHDFVPFRALAPAVGFAMTAHVVFTAIDRDRPATLSPTVIGEVIRRDIGFAGTLFSDDISMGALSGSIGERTRAALAAGCDIVLHCNGVLAEMVEVAANAPPMSDAPGAPEAFDLAADAHADERRWRDLMALAA